MKADDQLPKETYHLVSCCFYIYSSEDVTLGSGIHFFHVDQIWSLTLCFCNVLLFYQVGEVTSSLWDYYLRVLMHRDSVCLSVSMVHGPAEAERGRDPETSHSASRQWSASSSQSSKVIALEEVILKRLQQCVCVCQGAHTNNIAHYADEPGPTAYPSHHTSNDFKAIRHHRLTVWLQKTSSDYTNTHQPTSDNT